MAGSARAPTRDTPASALQAFRARTATQTLNAMPILVRTAVPAGPTLRDSCAPVHRASLVPGANRTLTTSASPIRAATAESAG